MFQSDVPIGEESSSRSSHSQATKIRRLQTKLQQQREDFVHALRNKLLTPVLADRRAVALFAEGAFGAVSDTQQTILKLLTENADKLLADIEAMIEIYRYQDGLKRLNIRCRPVSALLYEVCERFSGRAAEKSIELKGECEEPDFPVYCDPDEISTLLIQLADNALRFAKGKVTIMGKSSSDGKELILSVHDDGVGISSEDANKLFGRFYSLSAAGYYPAVTGVGLCLCYQIVTAHGGTIFCDSVPGKGTTFIVSLPRQRCQVGAGTGES